LTILVSYGEIALKGSYVRNRLEKQLAGHIAHQLKRAGYRGVKVTRRFGRIYVEGVPAEAAKVVAKVFGVVHTMPSTETSTEFESVVEAIVEESKKVLTEGDGFAVRPKVVGSHPYGSRDVAVEAGSRVLEEHEFTVHVNLDEPDVTLYAEVRDKAAYVYSSMVSGVKGLPYGSQGKVVSLFSGGIDSPVATWMMMKRGLDVHPLFMDQTPYVGPSYLDRVRKAFKAVADYVPMDAYRLLSAPMGPVMTRILEEGPESRYTCIMCKRSMYRIAEAYAKKNGLKAIVTGESLGQVASQTMANLYVLDAAVTIPVIRPLIGLDKVEIEDIARDIGTYELTARKVEGCTAVPPNPATRSRIEVVTRLEDDLGLPSLCMDAAESITPLDTVQQ
jgi:thiamine biosynthesis protein ThiI